tara:strand:- start:51 stop:419 length:369 start_codon:yes stop_codon:yes gene_type:complete
MTQLVPNVFIISGGKITLSDQEIVTELKNNQLFLKIIDFYSQLKISNQRMSEGKDACFIPITWTAQETIPPISCCQARYLLKMINVNNPFGKIVELSCAYLQDLKFNFNFTRKGLIYKKKFN